MSQLLVESREEVFDHAHETVIGTDLRPLRAELAEVWAYRDLLFLLIRRDISLRYRQSAIGVAWALIQPLLLMLIFTVVFGYFARLPSEGFPYPLFVLCGLLPWSYFSRSLVGASDSLVSSAGLLTKVYFPRLILPLSKAVAGLVDFAIAFGLLLVVLAVYRVMPGWGVLMLPVFIGIAFLTALALGLWLTALNVKYRDIGLLVPFVVQIWMYLSPIAYSTTLVPERWRWLYSLNPLVGVVEGFRWALIGKAPPSWPPILLSLAMVLVLFLGGLAYFRRAERNFADLV